MLCRWLCVGQRACAEAGCGQPKAVEMNAEGSVPPSGLASSGTVPESACGSQGNDVGKVESKQPSRPGDGRPISRKMARKLKRVALRSANSDKETHAEDAASSKATREIPSKPSDIKPSNGRAVVDKETSNSAVQKKGVHAGSCGDLVSTQTTAGKAVIKNAPSTLSESDSDQRIKAVFANGPSNSVVPPKTALQSTKKNGSRRGSVSEDGHPISRKMARKLKRVALRSANSDKETHAEDAASSKATREIPSKPSDIKPSNGRAVVDKETSNSAVQKKGVHAGSCGDLVSTQTTAGKADSKPSNSKCKFAPAPKQSYKVNLTQYKADATDAIAESAPIGASWANVVSGTHRGTTRRANWTTRDLGQSTTIGAKPSNRAPKKSASRDASSQDVGTTKSMAMASSRVPRSGNILACVVDAVLEKPTTMHSKAKQEQLDREGEREEGQKCTPAPVPKKEIYKNNMTKDEYLDWLERLIFEEGLLDSVSTNWCLEKLD
eukprot:jgi/Picsp_1/5074/NSC_02437-R1_---NA---